MAHPMTAPERPASGLDANARGIIVLAVAVAVGLGLLFNAGAGADESASSSSIPGPTVDVGGSTTTTGATGSTDTTAAGDSTTTSGPDSGEARPAGEVSVVVLNGSDKDNAAAANSETIGTAGYTMGTPAGATTDLAGNTIVYYAEGYEADATAVAAVLGKAADAVQPKPEDDLGPGASDANVVVVLGQADTAPVT